jgi:catechol 2,3-dioxygenase-like lactoylglutathione lyase family enzyme
MPGGLDHVVHAVRDLDAAGEFYARLGFTVGARNRHAWGTHNRNIQLPGFFVELLTVAEPEKLGSDGFSTLFGAYNRDFLTRQEGLSLMLLESEDAPRNAAAFRAAGIAASDAMRFEREGKRPDGSPVTVGFSVAFARNAQALEAAFAVCQQHYPENFWNPDFQRHANTASAIAGLVLVAENPADHHIFLSAYSGRRELQSTSTGVTVETARGELQVMDPAAFRSHFAQEPPDVSRGARIAAVRFAVRDLASAERTISAARVPLQKHMGRAIVGPASAHGATLVFEQAESR